MEGFLFRRGIFKDWISRYIELKDNVITYSVIKRGIGFGSFKLTPSVRCEENSIRPFCFSLEDQVTGSCLFLAADTVAEKESWIDAIQASLSMLRLQDRQANGSLQGKRRSVTETAEKLLTQYQQRPMMYVKVIQARNLQAKDMGGTSDPYVKLTLGGSTVRTTTRHKNLNPDWGMVFPFDWDRSMRFLKIEVWDEDYSSADDFLGSVFIPIFSFHDGFNKTAWYRLGKRSSKSHVSGDIEIEIACTGDPNADQHAWHFFREIQMLKEFRINLASRFHGSGQIALTNFGDEADIIPGRQQHAAGGQDKTTKRPKKSKNSGVLGFPRSFPPIENEVLEDISLRVHLVSVVNTGKVSSPGVLLLTNYRLLFVSLALLSSVIIADKKEKVPTEELRRGSLAVNSEGVAAVNTTEVHDRDSPAHLAASRIKLDMSTQIPINSIANVHLTFGADVTSNGSSCDVVRMRLTDGRTMSFLFKDDSTETMFSGTGMSGHAHGPAKYLKNKLRKHATRGDVFYDPSGEFELRESTASVGEGPDRESVHAATTGAVAGAAEAHCRSEVADHRDGVDDSDAQHQLGPGLQRMDSQSVGFANETAKSRAVRKLSVYNYYNSSSNNKTPTMSPSVAVAGTGPGSVRVASDMSGEVVAKGEEQQQHDIPSGLSPIGIYFARLMREQVIVSEALDAMEGPPANRFFNRLKHRSINRGNERCDAIELHRELLRSIREACTEEFSPVNAAMAKRQVWGDQALDYDLNEKLLTSRGHGDALAAAEAAEEAEEAEDKEDSLPGPVLAADVRPKSMPPAAVSAATTSEAGEAVSAAGVLTPSTDDTSTGVPSVSLHDVPSSSMLPSPNSRQVLPLGWDDSKDSSKFTEEERLQRRCSLLGLEQFIRSSEPVHNTFTKLLFNIDHSWNLYDPIAELRRMGVPNKQWRISNANRHYELCASYPAVLATPAAVDDGVLFGSAEFRSKGRVPALCWINAINGCSISRCSQPLVGMGSRSNRDDELLLSEINKCGQHMFASEEGYYTTLSASAKSNATGAGPSISVDQQLMSAVNGGAALLKPYIIVDARPLLNAKANQAAGKGVESDKTYDNISVLFMDIANIHAVRKSLELLEDSCVDEASWLRNLEYSGWLGHVRKILLAAARIVHCVSSEDLSVLVHCSDGWDRTSQLTSLSMLMMDDYYRTLDGFIVLVEKEWLSFGHKFADRLGWTTEGWKDEERSPVFAQFLDCVHQCLLQHPRAFEFNEQLLLFLMDHINSGWFGNFLFNCEQELKAQVHGENGEGCGMISVWTAVLGNRTLFINPSYAPAPSPVIPVVTKSRLVVWSAWFLRWSDRMWQISWIETNRLDMNKMGVAQSGAWVENDAVSACTMCSRSFSFFRRKHHCRCCGQIFCELCATEYRIMPTISKWRPCRCCLECARLIDISESESQHSSSFSQRTYSTATTDHGGGGGTTPISKSSFSFRSTA